MKIKFEEQALCRSEAARLFIRKKLPESDERKVRLADDDLILSVFFSEEIPDVKLAKQVCGLCPVKDSCLKQAVQSGISYGIWGGQFFKDGEIDTPKRRGRPPKVKNPAYEVPDIDIAPDNQRLIEEQKEKRRAA